MGREFFVAACETLDSPVKAEGPLLRALRCRPSYAHPLLLAAELVHAGGGVPSQLWRHQARKLDPKVPHDPEDFSYLCLTVTSWLKHVYAGKPREAFGAQHLWPFVRGLKTPPALLNDWQRRLFKLGWSERAQGFRSPWTWGLALDVVERMLEDDEQKDPRNYFAKMVILDALGRDVEAIKQAARTGLSIADRTLRDEPEDEFARSNRANAHRILGRRLLAEGEREDSRRQLQAARDILDDLIKRHFSDWLADRLGQTCLLLGDARGARDAYQRISRPTGRVRLGLADASTALGDYQSARQALEQYRLVHGGGGPHAERIRLLLALESNQAQVADLVVLVASTEDKDDIWQVIAA